MPTYLGQKDLANLQMLILKQAKPKMQLIVLITLQM